jgi:hypothetical protein
MKNPGNLSPDILKEIVNSGEQADLEKRRGEHFVNVIASSPDLNILLNTLESTSKTEAVSTPESRAFFEEAIRVVGKIIDQLTFKNNPLLPTDISGILEFVQSGKINVSMKYGLRTKVEELLEKLVSEDKKESELDIVLA